MVEMKDQAAFMKEVQARFERKLKENEIDMLEQWKGQLDKLAMMGNRIKMLKRDEHEGHR
jgi:hypothetical protein